MSRRHPHKKSRIGCSSCKRRHVKCDEGGPPCANCRVRDLECDFEAPTKLDTAPEGPLVDGGAIAAVGSRRLELELLHQWTCETYRSLVFKDGDERIWQTAIPQAAMDHEHLLNSIFAMSALHLASTRFSSLSQPYRLASLQYQNLAITAFRAEQRTVTMETSHVFFAFSSINFVLAMGSSSCQARDSRNTILDNLNIVFELLRGTVSIFTTGQAWLSNGPFWDVVRRPLNLQRENVDPDTRSAFDRLRSFRDEDYILRSASAEDRAGVVYLYECMTDTIEHLEKCFGLGGDGGQVSTFSWLAMLQVGFVEGIGRREPLPLLITMHWAILLNKLSSQRWWARSAGKMMVAEISAILAPCKPEWLPAMSWVHGQVGLPPLSVQ